MGFPCCRCFVCVWGVVFCLLGFGVGLCFVSSVLVCTLEITFCAFFVIFGLEGVRALVVLLIVVCGLWLCWRCGFMRLTRGCGLSVSIFCCILCCVLLCFVLGAGSELVFPSFCWKYVGGCEF